MRKRFLPAALVAALAFAGCGDGAQEDSITGVEPEQRDTSSSAHSDLSDTSEQPMAAVTKTAFYECVNGTDLKLAKEAGPVPGNPDMTRANFELDGTEYAGFVVWPSGAIADVWIANAEDGAEQAEDQYKTVWKQFGKGDQADEYVQRKGNAVVAFDDEQPPSPDEAPTLDTCLEPQ